MSTRGTITLFSAVLAVGMLTPPLAVAGVNVAVQVLNLAGKPLANAVVYAVPDTPPPPGPARTAIIDQIHRQFDPQVSVVEVGTRVDFPNSDNIMHAVYSFSPAKTFVLRLYAGRAAPPVTFNTPGIVVMGCQIHDTMIAWLLVVKTPYFAKTGPSGKLVLRDLRPGRYRLHAWDVGMRSATPARALTIVGGAPAPAITYRLRAEHMPRHGPAMAGMGSSAGM